MRTLNDNLKRGAWWRVMLAVLLLAPAAHAAEIHSNGRGGGAWSDPQTWHGHQVPEAADTVVIAMRDTVTFDRDDRAQPSCAALYLDPEAVLTFERGDHQRTLTVAGPVESYGTIRLDGTRNRGGRFALRLVGEGAEQRTIHLRENAALLLYGHEAHPNGERTVHLAADTLDPEAEAEAEMGRIAADGDAMIDLHHSRIQDFELALANLDNTGAESNERLNVIGNHLVGVTALKLHACDTPTIRDNHFQADGDVRRVMAIELRGVSLPEIRGNTIEGAYNVGIYTWGGTSETIQDNDIIGCNTGIRLHSTDPSVKNVRVSATERGVYLYHGNPVLEKVVVRDAALPYLLHESNAQFTDCSAPAPPPAEDEQEPADDAD
ncbi:MAG: right-handed parallel beta-helix repeat-containing protein, partial [Phycisphaeraceae bacterium]